MRSPAVRIVPRYSHTLRLCCMTIYVAAPPQVHGLARAAGGAAGQRLHCGARQLLRGRQLAGRAQRGAHIHKIFAALFLTTAVHLPRFTDKPERRAGTLGSASFAAHASFYAGEQWLGAPNAVLTGQAPGGAPVTVVVTLYSPAFSAANASLTYKVGSARAMIRAPGCGRVSQGMDVTSQACICSDARVLCWPASRTRCRARMHF